MTLSAKFQGLKFPEIHYLNFLYKGFKLKFEPFESLKFVTNPWNFPTFKCHTLAIYASIIIETYHKRKCTIYDEEAIWY